MSTDGLPQAKGSPGGGEEPLHHTEGSAGWGAFWWTVSFVFHGVVVAAAIYFTPLRNYFFGKAIEDPLKDVMPEEVRRVANELIGIAETKVRDDIKSMDDMLEKLRGARDTRYRFYVDETARFVKAGAADVPAAKALESLGGAGPAIGGNRAEMKLFSLYDLAQAVELNCWGVYRQMKSVELARIQHIDLQEAFDATKLALPVHPPINQSVFTQRIESVRDGKLAALKQELFRIRAETSDMAAAVKRMMDIADGLVGDSLPGALLLSAGGLQVSGGVLKWGASVGPPLSPMEIFPSGQGNLPANFLPPAARKLMKSTLASDWMALDTWYIIGPFPNPKREYMDKKFPPESIIDLDAVYVGKNNMKLEWEWTQAKPYWPVAPRVADSYAIWYGYTEIRSDKDQTKVFLFGSDDYSKVWVNGDLIYTSGKDPHHWIPDRGYQKVLLRKGINPILVKLENASGTTGFSVCIYLGDVGG
jgi:hypothetical protein